MPMLMAPLTIWKCELGKEQLARVISSVFFTFHKAMRYESAIMQC